MEKVLKVLFDYACPYCYRAHQYIKEVREEFPDLVFEFIPCEAHPRPENYGRHSDLCAMGMYYCLDNGIDLWEYHDLIYKAFYFDKINVESISEVSSYVVSLIGEEFKEAFTEALKNGMYQRKVEDNNDYTWEELNCPAVPSYEMGERSLFAVPGVGVSKEDIVKLVN